MKIEKFAETAIPVIFGIIVLLMVLYFVISAGFGILLLWFLLIPVYFVPSVWAYIEYLFGFFLCWLGIGFNLGEFRQ